MFADGCPFSFLDLIGRRIQKSASLGVADNRWRPSRSSAAVRCAGGSVTVRERVLLAAVDGAWSAHSSSPSPVDGGVRRSDLPGNQQDRLCRSLSSLYHISKHSPTPYRIPLLELTCRDEQIAVVSITGPQRSGKSYFLNRLAKQISQRPSDPASPEGVQEEPGREWEDPFDTSTTMNAGKGDVSVHIIPGCANPLPESPGTALLLLDTPGMRTLQR